MFIVNAIPTHIITGFLGAGKTTLLKALLAQKPVDEVWAVLMNEFGEIGIDQTWVDNEGIAVKEVLGGCLCCTSQLPMQITLARLIAEQKPTRLFIEPTGLGHPQQLLVQLSAAHWQQSLALQQVVTVLDGHRLHEQLWQQHEVFLQQLDVADCVLISHSAAMTAADEQALQSLQQAYQFDIAAWHKINHGDIALAMIDHPRTQQITQKQSLLSQQNTLSAGEKTQAPRTLPYHYHRAQQGYVVAGWCLPKTWQFDADRLCAYLQSIQPYERIKGKIHSTQGWVDINATKRQFEVDFSAMAGLDSRLEVISELSLNWQEIEAHILATLRDVVPNSER